MNTCDSSLACLASKSSGRPQGDEAAQSHAHDEDEDKAVAPGGHGGRAVHGGHGQLRETVDLREECSHFKKGKSNRLRDVSNPAASSRGERHLACDAQS